MELRKIEILLDKFYEANTTLEEEQQLVEFFRENKQLPEDLELHRGLILGMTEEKDVLLEEFTQHLSGLIDEKDKHSGKRRILTRAYWISGIAASILAAFLLVNLWNNAPIKQDETLLADTYSDPREGYEAAKATLEYVSSKFNKGVGQLEKVPDISGETKTLNRALSTYGKGLKQLEVLVNVNIN